MNEKIKTISLDDGTTVYLPEYLNHLDTETINHILSNALLFEFDEESNSKEETYIPKISWKDCPEIADTKLEMEMQREENLLNEDSGFVLSENSPGQPSKLLNMSEYWQAVRENSPYFKKLNAEKMKIIPTEPFEMIIDDIFLLAPYGEEKKRVVVVGMKNAKKKMPVPNEKVIISKDGPDGNEVLGITQVLHANVNICKDGDEYVTVMLKCENKEAIAIGYTIKASL